MSKWDVRPGWKYAAYVSTEDDRGDGRCALTVIHHAPSYSGEADEVVLERTLSTTVNDYDYVGRAVTEAEQILRREGFRPADGYRFAWEGFNHGEMANVVPQ